MDNPPLLSGAPFTAGEGLCGAPCVGNLTTFSDELPAMLLEEVGSVVHNSKCMSEEYMHKDAVVLKAEVSA